MTGIFDISGASLEYVMGHWGNFTEYEAKYYDYYDASQFTGTSSTNYSLCTLVTCGGHALYEITSWGNTTYDFVNSSNSWFKRGGGWSESNSKFSEFYTTVDAGTFRANYSTRLALVEEL